MIISKDNFEAIAKELISNLTPKNTKESKAIDFDISINNEPFTIRAYAPNNYRQIWVKPSLEKYNKLMQDKWWKDRTKCNWILMVDHDSEWRSGLSLRNIFDDWYKEVDFREFRYGNLPTNKKIFDNLSVVDCDKGDHLTDINDHKINVANLSLYQLIIVALKEMYQQGDVLRVDFIRNDDYNKRRNIQVLDDKLKRLSSVRDKISEKEVTFSENGLQKLLGKYDWNLYNIYHIREGIYFD